ncbi:ferritin-like domain-containing protein [Geodermatophilus sp. YIM 151500]|uniref:ferritin-like domain-containing protein n=1 Tax=Geodermatophilus sp. YIM 151500 TaxID=2984531 RepID=UPI0021E44701|nr:ferritin-like domain-containing protein [Geodermatophilus sp. YIM 151500]MCV2488990.1 ferritin-like domain-containing protein [Geodermatophilus sp. YIM 151500]
MADDRSPEAARDAADEDTALNEALAAEHAAVWGYGVVGAALPPEGRGEAVAAEGAHRDARDGLVALLGGRGVDPVDAEGGYELPFPVLSPVDAAALAAVLEDGVAAAWVRVLDRAVEQPVRVLAVAMLGTTEVRAVGWRAAAGQSPVTRAFPGLPEQ